jgi:hypothetical protein
MVENSKAIDLKAYEAMKVELQNLKVSYLSLSASNFKYDIFAALFFYISWLMRSTLWNSVYEFFQLLWFICYGLMYMGVVRFTFWFQC